MKGQRVYWFAFYLVCAVQLFPGISKTSAQISVVNPSFEGTSQAHVVPSPWSRCEGSGTPDTQPGQWGINLAPSDGNTYISCLYDGSGNHGWIEGASPSTVEEYAWAREFLNS